MLKSSRINFKLLVALRVLSWLPCPSRSHVARYDPFASAMSTEDNGTVNESVVTAVKESSAADQLSTDASKAEQTHHNGTTPAPTEEKAAESEQKNEEKAEVNAVDEPAEELKPAEEKAEKVRQVLQLMRKTRYF